MKYDSLRKTERDKELKKFTLANPDLSLEEIAGHYEISRQRVWQILHRTDKDILIERGVIHNG